MPLEALTADAVQTLRWVAMADDPMHVGRLRDICKRIGVGPGQAVADVGCGPLGALALLREIVGPAAPVVGVEISERLGAIARNTLRQRGVADVEIVVGDVNDLHDRSFAPARGFDAAFCRLLLANQTDPAHTLRAIASLVRDGGYIVAVEAICDPEDGAFDPPVAAAVRLRALWRELLLQQGRDVDAPRRLKALAREAGLDVLSEQSYADTDPRHAPRFIRSQLVPVLLSVAGTLLAEKVADEEEIRRLARGLEDAARATYETFAGWTFVELIARK